MNDQIATWDEFRQMLAQAYESVDVEYDRIADNLMHGTSRKDALHGMSTALAEARENFDKLVNLAIRLTPPEPPARPLEAVLADIEAEGHRAWTITRYPSGMLRVETALDGPEQPTGTTDRAAWAAYRTAREEGDTWNHGEAASSADVVPLLEARLSQIKELHAEYARRLERDGIAADVPDRVKRAAMDAIREQKLIHFDRVPGESACGVSTSARETTDDPDAVTCPTCQDWLRDNVNALTTGPYLVPGQGNPCPECRMRSGHKMDCSVGRTTAQQTTYNSANETRWNVWSKDCDGDWSVTNSNLNEEQALAAIKRLMNAALTYGPAGASFTMLPVGQVPGGPPVDETDALVFLNPMEEAEERAREADRVIAAHPSLRDDPEGPPVGDGPTDAAEAGWTVENMRVAAEEQRRIDIASEERE